VDQIACRLTAFDENGNGRWNEMAECAKKLLTFNEKPVPQIFVG
jgi:hypothetical protein